MQQLRLDFHYINFTFCKEQSFSNEKTSTLLAILDNLLNKMLDRSMTQDAGYALLRQFLSDHSI